MTESIRLDYCFSLSRSPEREDIIFYNGEKPPFRIYGMQGGLKNRIRYQTDIREELLMLGKCTAGGRIRFKTDADCLVVRVSLPVVHQMASMSLSGIIGCDAYLKENGGYIYAGTFMPPRYVSEVCSCGGYESFLDLRERKMRDITINLPLYNPVSGICIGVNQDAVIEKGDKYTHEKPIVFYGSSITQGGCASRPGNSYEAMLSRWFDTDIINMGFSGNAKAEKEIAEYIANMDMSIFVYDYDHNAPDTGHLERTHKRMLDIIRRRHPDIPVIIASRPKWRLNEEELHRRQIILQTYYDAKKNGDQNIFFADGSEFFKGFGGDDCCTVDGTHPNDLGFYAMALGIADFIKKIGL